MGPFLHNAGEVIGNTVSSLGSATGTLYGYGCGFVQRGGDIVHGGADLFYRGAYTVQQKSIAELGTRVLLFGAGVATGVIGLRMLRGVKQLKTVPEQVARVTKAAFWLGASAIELAASYMIPAFSTGAPQK